MVLFNYSTRELTAKIVFYGPGLCGKTTNLQYIYESLPETVRKGKMLSLATKTDRTLFFDFLPIDLGTIRGMKTRVQLYTVPGQVFYNSTRKLVLKGADGIVFVADSQSRMLEPSVESYKNLEENLREMGLKLEEIALVMQFNKRDLPNLSSVEEMNSQINRHNAPFYEAVATTGIGVEDTLKAITKLVLNSLAAKYRLEPAAQVEGASPAPGRAAAPQQPIRPAAAPSRPPAGPPVRPPAGPSRPSPIPVSADPEELALDGLEADSAPPARPAPRPAAPASPARPPARPAPLRAVPPPQDDILDLDDAIDLPTLDDPPDGTVDLGQDLLQELDEEPIPAPVRPAASRPDPAPRRGGTRQAPAAIDASMDLEEPLDLGEEWDEPATTPESAPQTQAIDLGNVALNQDRTVEVPLIASVDGRPVRLSLRLTVRLSR